ncbi:MAG TPA: hypothetical protein VFK88_09055 [Gallionella sp.]|nr:hypothetical protein [Gallionella sp.]
MIVDEMHDFTGAQRLERPENRSVAKTLGNTAGIEKMNILGSWS